MASGDIFSDMHTTTGTGGVDVRPATGVNVCITSFFVGSNYYNRFYTKNSSGVVEVHQTNNYNTPSNEGAWSQNMNVKIFITNSEYIHFRSSTGTRTFGYSGVEI